MKKISLCTLEYLVHCIKQNKYKSKSLQQVYIPTKNNKKKSLNIVSLIDKIVQKAVYFLLKISFDGNSKLYQLTKKKHCHTKLAELYNY
jgi:hypothetical protein